MDEIEFTNTLSGAKAIFNASQFGASGISNAVTITPTAAFNFVSVYLFACSPLSASRPFSWRRQGVKALRRSRPAMSDGLAGKALRSCLRHVTMIEAGEAEARETAASISKSSSRRKPLSDSQIFVCVAARFRCSVALPLLR